MNLLGKIVSIDGDIIMVMPKADSGIPGQRIEKVLYRGRSSQGGSRPVQGRHRPDHPHEGKPHRALWRSVDARL